MAVAVGVAAACGCAKDVPPSAPRDGRTMGVTQMMAAQGEDGGAVRDRAKLSSGQIVEVIRAANLGEMDQAELAQARATDPRVKDLAKRMLKDHTEADWKAINLTRKESLDLAPTPLSTSLERDAAASSRLLGQKVGADFDAAYVGVQVKQHQAVLDAIDEKLVPAVKDPDVKTFLGEVRPMIEKHLQRAEELQRAMQEK